ncbi:MAG: hypothetical protein M3R00_08860 [Pseudomonadota bacterium]|nr:hypothetical protein [Pseudomonadota bacterium]
MELIKKLMTSNEACDFIFNYLYYCEWARIAINQKNSNSALVECYSDIALNYYTKLRRDSKRPDEICNAQKIATIYQQLTQRHEKSGEINCAIRCYSKAKSIYDNGIEKLKKDKHEFTNLGFTENYIQNELRKFFTSIVQISQSINNIQKPSFLIFKKWWDENTLPDTLAIVFQEDKLALIIRFNNKELYTTYLQQLTYLQQHFSTLRVEKDTYGNLVTLSPVHEIQPQRIWQSLVFAQKRIDSEMRQNYDSKLVLTYPLLKNFQKMTTFSRGKS